jgi:glucokinase
MTYLLCGDIGGTNTRLAVFGPSSKDPIYNKEYRNISFITDTSKSFESDIFAPFLDEADLDDDKDIVACFAVAGPVRNNCVTLTNLGGHVVSDLKNDDNRMEVKLDGKSIEQNSNGALKRIVRCKIINDFVGQGYGLLDVDLDSEVIELLPGSKTRMDPFGPKACVGAGTGLGECFLTTSSLHPEEGYECYASEGGHVDYAPRTELEVGLWNYLKKKFDQQHRISVERVVSGKGLANCYEYLASIFPNSVTEKVHEEFEKANDMQGRVVGIHANQATCRLCVQAMEIMMAAYGAECGNASVKFIPTGGLYVSGGLTPKNINFMKGADSPFMKAYHDKGRLSGLLDSIPLFAVMVGDLGMRGARVCAMREYQSMKI